MNKNIYFFVILNFIFSSPCITIQITSNNISAKQNHFDRPLIIQTLYGDFEIIEPVLIDLLNSQTMQRIKGVRQYGSTYYVTQQKEEYTRYEHCVGVWALLKKYGANLEEQIAGLLHDASHTVFSHVGDVLFKHESELYSYQDSIHEWYLKQQKVDSILANYNISFDAVADHTQHAMLEQNLPDICADRLEYNLHAGILTDMLTIEDIATILNDLHYAEGNWFFTNQQSAKKLALVSLFNTQHAWGSSADHFINQWTANALERALEIELLTLDDIHFSTDDIVWNKLLASNDQVINRYLYNIINHEKIISIDTDNKEYMIIKGKCRGLDPLIKKGNQLKRLTSLDEEYKAEYHRVKNLVEQGQKVTLL